MTRHRKALDIGVSKASEHLHYELLSKAPSDNITKQIAQHDFMICWREGFGETEKIRFEYVDCISFPKLRERIIRRALNKPLARVDFVNMDYEGPTGEPFWVFTLVKVPDSESVDWECRGCQYAL